MCACVFYIILLIIKNFSCFVDTVQIIAECSTA